jgi:hypothetical protein
MKHLVIILMLINSLIIANAQQIKVDKVIKVSDSIMIANTNENLFKFFMISEGSYYKYLKDGKKLSTGKFLNINKLDKNTMEIWVLYHLIYPKVEGVNGGVWVKLDFKLKPIEKLDLSFVPGFLWNNDSCNFISKQEVLKIGIKSFQKGGIEIDEPILGYSESFKRYTYTITNKLTKTKNQMDKDAGQSENVRIDAITGELLERFDSPYGVIIR